MLKLISTIMMALIVNTVFAGKYGFKVKEYDQAHVLNENKIIAEKLEISNNELWEMAMRGKLVPDRF